MKYGNTTYKEDDLIERTTKALESRLEGMEGNDLILQLKLLIVYFLFLQVLACYVVLGVFLLIWKLNLKMFMMPLF